MFESHPFADIFDIYIYILFFFHSSFSRLELLGYSSVKQINLSTFFGNNIQVNFEPEFWVFFATNLFGSGLVSSWYSYFFLFFFCNWGKSRSKETHSQKNLKKIEILAGQERLEPLEWLAFFIPMFFVKKRGNYYLETLLENIMTGRAIF